MNWVHVGGFVNVIDGVDAVTEVAVVKPQEFAVAICSVDEIGGVPKITAPV